MSALLLFGDVEPVPAPEVANEVVPIAYPEDYAQLMGYFRAVVASGELSPRVVELTAEILEHNAAHYSVWALRRKCLTEAELDEELEYTEQVAAANPKNYQVWFHRRELVDRTDRYDVAERELVFVDRMLASDAKNYHAWSHRLWVLKRFGCWDRELEFVDDLLRADVWNNSAWNHRHSTVRREPVDEAKCVDEVEYAIDKALPNPANESPWVYALSFARSSPAAARALSEACDFVLTNSTDDDPNDRACARMTKVDLLADRNTPECFEEAADHAEELGLHEDTFRTRYWSRRADRLRGEAYKLRNAST